METLNFRNTLLVGPPSRQGAGRKCVTAPPVSNEPPEFAVSEHFGSALLLHMSEDAKCILIQATF